MNKPKSGLSLNQFRLIFNIAMYGMAMSKYKFFKTFYRKKCFCRWVSYWPEEKKGGGFECLRKMGEPTVVLFVWQEICAISFFRHWNFTVPHCTLWNKFWRYPGKRGAGRINCLLFTEQKLLLLMETPHCILSRVRGKCIIWNLLPFYMVLKSSQKKIYDLGRHSVYWKWEKRE